jgi:UDP-galactopyranose mutase
MACHDYLIVGCGMFGAVFARAAAEAGRTVLIVDKRDHIAGNCYSESVEGIQVHRYGPHIFHTDDERIWRFVNRFAPFNHYVHHGRVRHAGRTFSFPINLLTLAQLWGVNTPAEAAERLGAARAAVARSSDLDATRPADNLRDWIVSQVGEELYEIFVRGYTTKQWGRDPSQLPAAIIRRLPIRMTYDDRYFEDRFQGIPIGGYTRLFENMLDHDNIRIELGVDYLAHARPLATAGTRMVYTGKIDEFFDYRHGELAYRSLRFETEVLDGDFQGASIINYADQSVPYTRITEHKHFEFCSAPRTVITREYPQDYTAGKIPYYPIRDAREIATYERYRREAEQSEVLFGGRLATYQYYDMHQVIGQALAMAGREFGAVAAGLLPHAIPRAA